MGVISQLPVMAVLLSDRDNYWSDLLGDCLSSPLGGCIRYRRSWLGV